MSKRRKKGWCRANTPWYGHSPTSKVREFEKALNRQRLNNALHDVAIGIARRTPLPLTFSWNTEFPIRDEQT